MIIWDLDSTEANNKQPSVLFFCCCVFQNLQKHFARIEVIAIFSRNMKQQQKDVS